MSYRNEQIGGDRRIINAAWHWVKKQTARLRRREARRLLDDAPKKNVYRGYVA